MGSMGTQGVEPLVELRSRPVKSWEDLAFSETKAVSLWRLGCRKRQHLERQGRQQHLRPLETEGGNNESGETGTLTECVNICSSYNVLEGGRFESLNCNSGSANFELLQFACEANVCEKQILLLFHRICLIFRETCELWHGGS